MIRNQICTCFTVVIWPTKKASKQQYVRLLLNFFKKTNYPGVMATVVNPSTLKFIRVMVWTGQFQTTKS